tara:strand:- start:834328 stop:835599 length:1272 start_codon:yes stop_codon:yes gene_type:complete
MDTPEMNSCKWLFFDLNSYFASVEQQERPELRGKPIAVVPMDSDYTCAIAASYEAKAFGVKTGMRIKEARQICPSLITVPARHDKYVEYHQRILSEMVKYTPINKVCSVDEFSSCLPPNKRNADDATAVALRMKAGLRDNVGAHMRCSIGIAPNAYLAKVATNLQKPDGLVILSPDTMCARLFALALTDLPGISTGMEARLLKGGVSTVEQFWNLSPKHARKIWGGVGGERFWYRLHGYEIPEQETKTSMIGHSRVLDPELRSPENARKMARRLTVKAASRLRRQEFYAGCFQLSLRTENDLRWEGTRKLSPAQDNFAFLKVLEELWVEMARVMPPARVKKISIAMVDLCKRTDITPDLFDQKSEPVQAVQQQNDALTDVMDVLNQKYGAESVKLGLMSESKAASIGTKIAFSRVPEMEEFLE